MISTATGEQHKGTLDGIKYSLTRTEWVIWLGDKAVFDHITANCMRQRFKKQKSYGYTDEQCLGITELILKHSIKKKLPPMVSKSQTPMYQQVNKFLSRRLA